MLRNKLFRRAFVDEPIELHMTMKPFYGVLMDSCDEKSALNKTQTATNLLLGSANIEKNESLRLKTVDNPDTSGTEDEL